MELPQLLQQYASMSVSMHVRPCPNLFENCKELYVVCTWIVVRPTQLLLGTPQLLVLVRFLPPALETQSQPCLHAHD